MEARPYDAYVFTAKEAAKLTGWKKSYSGNAGYFRQYKHHWDQPQRWQEGWGLETEIFGLTPEDLVERSQRQTASSMSTCTAGICSGSTR